MPTPPPPPPVLRPHPQMRGVDLQTTACVQEVGHPADLQHGVDRHPSPRRGIQQVLNDLQVRHQVHDDGDHLGRGVGGPSSAFQMFNSMTSVLI